MLLRAVKEDGLRFVILFNIMDNPIPSTSQTNTDFPGLADTIGLFKRIMRIRNLTTWDKFRDVIDLLQNVCH